jgi:hypothetical protein
MHEKPVRPTWKQVAAYAVLAFVWCWFCGLGIRILIGWGEIGMLAVPSSTEEWARGVLGWFVVSTIAAPIIGICVHFAPSKRSAIIVILGGMIPSLILYGLLFLILGR